MYPPYLHAGDSTQPLSTRNSLFFFYLTVGVLFGGKTLADMTLANMTLLLILSRETVLWLCASVASLPAEYCCAEKSADNPVRLQAVHKGDVQYERSE